MALPTVSRFCFCCDLATGNKVVAWIYAIIYFIFVIFAIIALVFGLNVDVTEYKEVEVTSFQVDDQIKNETIVKTEVREFKSKKFSTAESLIAIIIVMFLAFVALWFVHGINLRDKGKMMPYIIQHGIFGVLFLCAAAYFLEIYFFVKSAISLYVTVCAYSLYQVFAYEDAQRQENAQMNANLNEYSQSYEMEAGAGGDGENFQQFQGP